jgi:hypothetical protein
MKAWQFNNPPWEREFPFWRRHGSEMPGHRLFATYKGPKYHVEDDNKRFKVCTKCGPVIPGIKNYGWGYRYVTHEPLRNSTMYKYALIMRQHPRFR